MAIEQMAMPQLGERDGRDDQQVAGIPGDQVNKYDPIAEVMTDKVNAEVPSSLPVRLQNL